MFKKIYKAITQPKKLLLFIINKCSRLFSDEIYLQIVFRLSCGYWPDLKSPKTFNEKLNWLKLHDRKPIYTIMADKLSAKQYVSNIIGEQYVVPCYGVWEKLENIDFATLPDKFVIKMNHDSSGAFICKDKAQLNMERLQSYIKTYFGRNYYWHLREWPYKNIEPRIFAEELLDDHTGETLRDYKFWCFNGVPTYMYCTVKGRAVYENFYDMEFTPVAINHGYPRHYPEFEKPKGFETMKKLAEKLAVGLPFIRVDFFEVGDRIYFGEYTFYDWGGMSPFVTKDQDLELGKLIDLDCDEK